MSNLFARIASDVGDTAKSIAKDSATGVVDAAKDIGVDILETAAGGGTAPTSTITSDVSKDPELMKKEQQDRNRAHVRIEQLRAELAEVVRNKEQKKQQEQQVEQQQQAVVEQKEEKKKLSMRQRIMAQMKRASGTGEVRKGKD